MTVVLRDLVGLRQISSAYWGGGGALIEIDSIWYRFSACASPWPPPEPPARITRDEWSRRQTEVVWRRDLFGAGFGSEISASIVDGETIHEIDLTVVIKRNLNLLVEFRAAPIGQLMADHHLSSTEKEATRLERIRTRVVRAGSTFLYGVAEPTIAGAAGEHGVRKFNGPVVFECGVFDVEYHNIERDERLHVTEARLHWNLDGYTPIWFKAEE